MKLRTLLFILLSIVFIGCNTTTAKKIRPVTKVSHHSPEVNRPVVVTPGNMMMQTTRGEHFKAYRLDQEASGSKFGNKCYLSPQVFVRIEKSGDYFYALSQTDVYQPVESWNPRFKNLRCGIQFSKKDLKIIGTVVQFKNGSLGEMGLDQKVQPVMAAISMVNIYNPNFLRKTLKFDSFDDDFLSLRYMEERGTQNGYDVNGNPISVPPDVHEQIYEFDLQESNIISFQDGQIEIIEAQPDKIVYKLIREMSDQ